MRGAKSGVLVRASRPVLLPNIIGRSSFELELERPYFFRSRSCAPALSTSLFSTTSSPKLLPSQFIGTQNLKLRILPARLGPFNGLRTICWFKFGKNGVDAENAGSYGSQSRDEFDRDDVEQAAYFNMRMLAVEGTYSKMEALLSLNIHPVDILLILAATEGDRPKIEELLRADGRTALDRANSEEIRDSILGYTAQMA